LLSFAVYNGLYDYFEFTGGLKMNIATFLITILEEIGVKHGFSLVGGMSMHLNCAAGSGQLTVTYCNHEQAVVASADGYAKACGFSNPGLAMVTSGPGVTNTVTALASAFFDSVPLILISGQIKLADLNRFAVRSYGAQEVAHDAILGPVTKMSFLYEPNLIDNFSLARRLALSMIGRKGPVHIDVPLDVQAMDVKNGSDVQEVVRYYFSLLELDANQVFTSSPEPRLELNVVCGARGRDVCGVWRREEVGALE